MARLIDTKKEFSFIERGKSFARASRGIYVFFKTTHSAWLQVMIFLFALGLGFYFKISSAEWAMLVFASGFVFVSEAFNTAIEIDINLTSPQYHPYARDTKDVAAGAVLLSSFCALIVGILIFSKYLFG